EWGHDPLDHVENRLLPLKQTFLHPLEPPLPLHVDVVGPVHHDLGDVGILEQELDGSQPDDRVRDLVDDSGEGALWQDVSLLAKDRERVAPHSSPSRRIEASRLTDRPVRPRPGSRRPRSCAEGIARSTRMTTEAGCPNTRSTSAGEMSARPARLT